MISFVMINSSKLKTLLFDKQVVKLMEVFREMISQEAVTKYLKIIETNK